MAFDRKDGKHGTYAASCYCAVGTQRLREHVNLVELENIFFNDRLKKNYLFPHLDT